MTYETCAHDAATSTCSSCQMQRYFLPFLQHNFQRCGDPRGKILVWSNLDFFDPGSVRLLPCSRFRRARPQKSFPLSSPSLTAERLDLLTRLLQSGHFVPLDLVAIIESGVKTSAERPRSRALDRCTTKCQILLWRKIVRLLNLTCLSTSAKDDTLLRFRIPLRTAGSAGHFGGNTTSFTSIHLGNPQSLLLAQADN